VGSFKKHGGGECRKGKFLGEGVTPRKGGKVRSWGNKRIEKIFGRREREIRGRRFVKETKSENWEPKSSEKKIASTIQKRDETFVRNEPKET